MNGLLLLMSSKYRYRKSIRLQSWDYRRSAFYFVTICTKDQKHYFGDIRDGKMGLSVQGCAAWYFWKQIPAHSDNVQLDAFVVMPNHVHGIIQILPDEKGVPPVGTLPATSLQTNNRNRMSEISPKPGSLSTIIRSYKSGMTRWCNRKGYEFCWQSRFHDHIIRNYRSLNRIRQYIECNPLNWEKDSKNVL